MTRPALGPGSFALALLLSTATLSYAQDTAPGPRFTPQDFAGLRWLAGDWRGRMADGSHFFERRAVVDDSTMSTQGYGPDSTFTTVRESGNLVFRAGMIASVGGTRRSEATHVDSARIDLQRVGASNRTSFTRQSADQWTATLTAVGPDGRTREVVYVMERLKR